MRVATQRRSARQPPRGHPPPRRPVAAAAPAQPAASAAAPSPPPPPRRRPRPRAPSAVPAAPALRTLYPQPPLFSSLRLAVAPPHVLSVTQWGNPAGAPVLAVHGGPGAGSFPSHARFFDPQFYRVVLVDQRGCGSSAPAGLLAGQGCAPLVGDLEAVRRALGVDRWHVVFGGSWGVALSLAYAGAHPHRVGSLLLRSVCLMRAADIDWAYRRHGHAGTAAAHFFPDHYAAFLDGVGLHPSSGRDPVEAAVAALCGRDAARRDRAAQAWLAWGSHLGGGSAGPCVPGGAPPGADGGGDGAAAAAALRWSRTARAWAPAPGRAAGPGGAGAAAARAALRGAAARPPPPPPPATPDRPPPPWRTLPPPPAAAAVPARADWTVQPLLESYYCLRHATFDAPAAAVPPLSPSPSPPFPGVLLGAPTFRASAARVPLVAVHGARDWLCRAEGAARLAGAWGRGAAVLLLPASGHGAYDAATVDALVGAADELRGGAPGGGGGGGG